MFPSDSALPTSMHLVEDGIWRSIASVQVPAGVTSDTLHNVSLLRLPYLRRRGGPTFAVVKTAMLIRLET